MAFDYRTSKAWTAYAKNASQYQYRSDGERLRGTLTCDTVPAAAVSGGARRGALTVRLEYEEYKMGDRVYCRGTTTICEGSVLAGVFNQPRAGKQYTWMRPLLLEMLSSATGGGGVCVQREAGGAIVFGRDVEVPNSQAFLFYLAGKGVLPEYRENGKRINYALIDNAVGGGKKGVFRRYGEAKRDDDDEDPHANGFNYVKSKAWTAYAKTSSKYKYRSDGERLRGTFTCDTVPAAAVSGGARRGALTVRLEYEEYKYGDQVSCRGTTTILEGSVLAGVFDQPNADKQYSWMRPLLLEMLSFAGGGGGGVCVQREEGGAVAVVRDVEVPNSQAFLFYLAGKGVQPKYRENGKSIHYALNDSAVGGGRKGVFKRVVSAITAAPAAVAVASTSTTSSASAADSGSQKKLPRSVRLERYLASLDEQARLKRERGDEEAAAAVAATSTSNAVVKQERKYARRR